MGDVRPERPDPLSARAEGVAARAAARVERDGYVIVHELLEPDRCARLVREIDRIERERSTPHGANDFEGFRTRRIFNLIAHGPLFHEVVIDPTLLAIVEAILGEGFLLSGTTSMHIEPGETDQLLHPDDGMVTLPRPHPPTMVTALFALSAFRAENGATRLIPGSHRDPAIMPSPASQADAIRAEMPAGSAVILNASTFHGGGANTTANVDRHGLSVQFVAGWCRQQQNLMLGTPREVVARYPRRLQELIGYSIYRGVMGHVERAHPLRLLGTDVESKMVWDDIGPEPARS